MLAYLSRSNGLVAEHTGNHIGADSEADD
jgi:hypothetical protein